MRCGSCAFLARRGGEAVAESQVAGQEEKEDIVTNFELADNIYAKAKVSNTGIVFLWLGVRRPAAAALLRVCGARVQANVMLEYPRQEAQELLTRNLKCGLGARWSPVRALSALVVHAGLRKSNWRGSKLTLTS